MTEPPVRLVEAGTTETNEEPELGKVSESGQTAGEECKPVGDEVTAEPPNPFILCVNQLAEKLDADVWLFNGPIEQPADRELVDLVSRTKKRKNAFLIMVTSGGDPNAGYRIARCFQENYEKYFLCVSGLCKSAGTLIAIGANELIISDHGELGPLDIQLYKKDELGEKQSGWTLDTAIDYLSGKAFETFESIFLQLKIKSFGLITVPTPSKIAADVTTGLFAKIFEQFDPVTLGETQRALKVASEYGKILLEKGGNIGEDELSELISKFPSHGFIIDRKIAESIFKKVRAPEDIENILILMIGDDGKIPGKKPQLSLLSEELQQEEEKQEVK
jgi:hypothetical protein